MLRNWGTKNTVQKGTRRQKRAVHPTTNVLSTEPRGVCKGGDSQKRKWGKKKKKRQCHRGEETRLRAIGIGGTKAKKELPQNRGTGKILKKVCEIGKGDINS